MKHMNWDDVKLLIAVAKAGTFRIASRTAGLSPATLSRRIDDLEAALGQKLLERHQTGCTPTPAGTRIITWAEQMQDIAFEIERTRDQPTSDLAEGVVRINTDEWMSYFLTTRLHPFHERHPNVDVEIITSHRPYSLMRREADIAIRPFRPAQMDLVARKVGVLRYGLHCSHRFHAKHREAIERSDWSKLHFVGFDEPRAEFDADRWLRALPGAPAPWIRCSYGLGIFDGVIHDAGLGVLANFITADTRELHAVKAHIPELDQEIWLSMHKGLTSSARVRAVTDFVYEIFARDLGM